MSRELIWPPSLRITSMERRLIGNAGVSRSPPSGATTTVDRSGARWALSVTVENLSDRASYAERANAEAFLAAIRNRNARVWIHDPGYAPRGSFSAPELFANADFANGATGWTAQQCTLSVADRVMRLTAARTSTSAIGLYQSVTAVQYAPLVLRGMLGARSRTGISTGTFGNSTPNYSADAQGLIRQSWTPLTTSVTGNYPAVFDGSGNVSVTGDWFETPFVSLAHCALVDNGPNALLYSDQLDNAAWSKGASTVTVNAATAPDGTTTADALVEAAFTAQHYAWQVGTRASAAEDICAYGFFKRGSGTRNVRLIAGDGTLVNYGQAFFDLGAGTFSLVSLAGSATNARAFMVAAGNGWYYCAVVVQVPTSTGISNYAELTSGTTVGYAGDGASSIYAWRCGAARSSVPTRGALTTATALASGASQTGSGLYLKGLPASTIGLLLAGDAVQIGKQLFTALAPLDSNAAGLGYLALSPNIRTPFADNDPVIVNQPMGRYLLASDSVGYSTRPGRISTTTLEFEEALD